MNLVWDLGISLNYRVLFVPSLATRSPYSDPSQYGILVGRFIYFTISRPKIINFVHILSQIMQEPQQAH